MKALVLATLAAASLAAYAGEDSTERWGANGTGPAYWETPCGLRGFTGPGDKRPCSAPLASSAQDASADEMRAAMQLHMKRVDEMMIRMNDEHRSMMGGTGGRGTGGGEDAH